jgi:predicted nuclease with TOPRIM domain
VSRTRKEQLSGDISLLKTPTDLMAKIESLISDLVKTEKEKRLLQDDVRHLGAQLKAVQKELKDADKEIGRLRDDSEEDKVREDLINDMFSTPDEFFAGADLAILVKDFRLAANSIELNAFERGLS